MSGNGDPEGNDGDLGARAPNPGGPGAPGWELANLVGRYETFTAGVERRLGKIEKKLEDGSKAFGNIDVIMARKEEHLEVVDSRLESLEEQDITLSKRRRWQIDGTALAAILLTLKEIVLAVIGWLH